MTWPFWSSTETETGNWLSSQTKPKDLSKHLSNQQFLPTWILQSTPPFPPTNLDLPLFFVNKRRPSTGNTEMVRKSLHSPWICIFDADGKSSKKSSPEIVVWQWFAMVQSANKSPKNNKPNKIMVEIQFLNAHHQLDSPPSGAIHSKSTPSPANVGPVRSDVATSNNGALANKSKGVDPSSSSISRVAGANLKKRSKRQSFGASYRYDVIWGPLKRVQLGQLGDDDFLGSPDFGQPTQSKSYLSSMLMLSENIICWRELPKNRSLAKNQEAPFRGELDVPLPTYPYGL